jgi:hypothetical protein
VVGFILLIWLIDAFFKRNQSNFIHVTDSKQNNKEAKDPVS